MNIYVAFHYWRDLRDFGGLETDAELALLLDKSFDLLGCWVNLSEKKNYHPKHFVDHEATS